MITVTDTKGQKHHLALDAIARVSEASAACRWHGVHAYIKTFDGQELGVKEEANQVIAQIVVEEARRDPAGQPPSA